MSEATSNYVTIDERLDAPATSREKSALLKLFSADLRVSFRNAALAGAKLDGGNL